MITAVGLTVSGSDHVSGHNEIDYITH